MWRDLELLLISPHGSSGSHLMQSLLDSHKQIIHFPVIFQYPEFRQFSSFHVERWPLGQTDTLELFIDNFIEKHVGAFDLRKSTFRLKGFNLLVSSSIFKQEALKLFHEHSEGIITTRFYIQVLHLAYAKTIGLPVHDLRYMMVHLHGYNGSHFHALSDFPSLKYIALTRDPRENCVSYYRSLEIDYKERFLTLKKVLIPYYILKYAFNIRSLVDFSNCLSKNQLLIADLNILHSLGDTGLHIISKFLGVNYDEKMNTSTILGRPWLGNSGDKKPIEGLNPARSLLKWPRALNKIDLDFIELYLGSIMTLCRYNTHILSPKDSFHENSNLEWLIKENIIVIAKNLTFNLLRIELSSKYPDLHEEDILDKAKKISHSIDIKFPGQILSYDKQYGKIDESIFVTINDMISRVFTIRIALSRTLRWEFLDPLPQKHLNATFLSPQTISNHRT